MRPQAPVRGLLIPAARRPPVPAAVSPPPSPTCPAGANESRGARRSPLGRALGAAGRRSPDQSLLGQRGLVSQVAISRRAGLSPLRPARRAHSFRVPSRPAAGRDCPRPGRGPAAAKGSAHTGRPSAALRGLHAASTQPSSRPRKPPPADTAGPRPRHRRPAATARKGAPRPGTTAPRDPREQARPRRLARCAIHQPRGTGRRRPTANHESEEAAGEARRLRPRPLGPLLPILGVLGSTPATVCAPSRRGVSARGRRGQGDVRTVPGQ